MSQQYSILNLWNSYFLSDSEILEVYLQYRVVEVILYMNE